MIISAALLLLEACASAPGTGKKFQRIETPNSGRAALYIYAPRTGMPVLGQMSTEVFIDGKQITRIDEGLFFRIEVTPGVHRLHASTDSQMSCGGQFFPGRRYAPVVLDASANSTYLVRYSSHPIVRKATSCDRHLRLVEDAALIGELADLEEAVGTQQQ
jgi:hypothetical protein